MSRAKNLMVRTSLLYLGLFSLEFYPIRAIVHEDTLDETNSITTIGSDSILLFRKVFIQLAE